MELSCIRMRNWVREGLAVFCFLVWIERSVLLVHEVSLNKISASTEAVGWVLIYLYMVSTF